MIPEQIFNMANEAFSLVAFRILDGFWMGIGIYLAVSLAEKVKYAIIKSNKK